MSMLLLVDEDTKSKKLVRLLNEAGHDVATTADLGLDGMDDAAVLQEAKKAGRAVLTHNCSDFHELHQADDTHSGIIGVYRDADPSKCLNFEQIVNALRNLEGSGYAIASNYHQLNQWHY